jgi:hypothetical protein
MKQFESEFVNKLNAVTQDARTCAVFNYTQLAFHHVAGSNPLLVDRVNEHADFWNGMLGALQAAAIIALGRLYDKDLQAHTLGELLDFAEKYVGVFSSSSLKARLIAKGMTDAEAEIFVSTAHDTKRGSFDYWRRELDELQSLYAKKIKPIRDQVFAHAGKITKDERDDLFTDVFNREIERLAVFPLQLTEALFQLFHNGYEPKQTAVETNIVDVMKSLPDKKTIALEHLRAAKTVAGFLHTLLTVLP